MLRSLVTQVILAMTLAFFSVACASDSSPPSSSSSSSSSSTSTSEAVDPEDEEQAVIDAYLAAIDAFYLAANPPDPEHPALTRRYGEPLLTNVQEFLRQLADDGVVLERGSATANHPRLRSLSGNRAELTDCLNDADVQRDRESLEVVNDEVVYAEFTALLELREGTWVLIGRSQTAERTMPC